jgi:hypothetical protein
MSSKPDHLSVSDHHHHHHHHPISHSSIQSLPVPASSGSRFCAPLPALQDPRYDLLLFPSVFAFLFFILFGLCRCDEEEECFFPQAKQSSNPTDQTKAEFNFFLSYLRCFVIATGVSET